MRGVTLFVTGLCLLLMNAAAYAATSDHLKCYRIKDPVALQGIADLSAPPFKPEPGCKISRVAVYCVAASKTAVSVLDKLSELPIVPLAAPAPSVEGDQVCYKLKCPVDPAHSPHDKRTTHQFGTRTFTKFKASLFCAPAVKAPSYCGDGTIEAGEDCDGTSLNDATCASLGFTGGVLACAPGCSFDTTGCKGVPRTGGFLATGQTSVYAPGDDGALRVGAPLSYTDNGDGPITDNNTGLMWEKKSDDDGLHDKDSAYSWNPGPAWNPGPGSIWEWIAQVNAEGSRGFAGHADWRIPNVRELQSIVNYQISYPAPMVSAAFNGGCVPGCTVLTCSCTVAPLYWSSTTYVYGSGLAWGVSFSGGSVNIGNKLNGNPVRAVRGGS